MKKVFSIFMIFLLTSSTIGPLPAFAETVDFPGSVVGGSADNRIVTVTMNEEGYTLTLHKHRDHSAGQEQVGTAITGYTVNAENKFSDVGPGLYFVKATKATIVKISGPIEVKPEALTVGESTTNIISPTNDPYKLIATGVSGQSVRLYNNDNQTYIKQLPVTSSGTVTFDGVDIAASAKYQVTQVVNGAESLKSPYIEVRPNVVQIEKIKDSGPSNKAGEILVKNAKQGNTLVLYKGGNVVEREVKNIPTSEYTFGELPAGNYRVKHIENGVASKDSSDDVDIRNEQVPIIDLEGAANYELRYEIDANHNIKPKKYEEPGYIVTDKNGTVYRGKTTAYFCTEISGEGQAGNNSCAPLKMKVEVIDKVTEEVTQEGVVTPPGKYTVTYIATDGGDVNLTSTIVRNVTVYPNHLNLSKKDTEEANPALPIIDRTTGSITVKGVYAGNAGATLKLMQDIDGAAIEVPGKSAEKVNDGEFTFKDVPVGSGYFVLQEVNGVQSAPSARVDIKDTTPPKLTLNDSDTITLEVGDQYVEHGATAIDNIDTTAELAGRIQISGSVNTSIPGKYPITYNVQDKAGNNAIEIQRTIYVKPRPVTAIGSIATIGEVGVANIFPGNISRPTYLKLYKYNNLTEIFEVVSVINKDTFVNNEITHVFKIHGPGSYYVTQIINEQESRESNIVEIIDVDRPYITLDGPDKIELTWDVNRAPYYEKTDQTFTDPGAFANDYLEPTKLDLTATLLKPNGEPIQVNPVTAKGDKVSFTANTKLPEPGTYKIIYTAKAPRGSEADPKHRIVTLAPPKTGKPTSTTGKSEINVTSIFEHATSVANLYNTYGQLIDSKNVKNTRTVDFTEVPAGLGYYVTQTINGIESAPSNPVNVSLFEAEKDLAFFTSFGFKNVNATGIIDTENREITVTVPKGTDRTKLIAEFKATGIVEISGTQQTSGTTINDFANKISYKVYSKDPSSKNNSSITYSVNVIESNNSSTIWKDTVTKNVTISTTGSPVTLTPAEKAVAAEKGITFMTLDTAIFVPASNVKETATATLTAKKSNVMPNATELNWGNSKKPFMQPIELELSNPSERGLLSTSQKVFAKIVQENGKTYTIIQPSELNGENIIGLATEPGTYALVDNIQKPTVTLSSKIDGKDTYKLNSTVAGGQIYYTTSSSNILFDRSSRAAKRTKKLEGYLMDGTPSDLSNWTAYSGESIPMPNDELYAFVMKDNKMSLITALETKQPVEWRKNVPTYPTHKVLSITFNTKVDRKALYAGTIYVTDDLTGIKLDTTLTLSTDGKTILVAPEKAYTRGKYYTLHIDRQFKGNTKNKEFLKQPLTQTFLIQ